MRWCLRRLNDMVRIGVISDTHGSAAAISACIAAAGEVDGWFHLGDYARDARLLAEKTGKPVYSVTGNCDGFAFSATPEIRFPDKQTSVSSEAVVTVGGARIFLCHGHTYGVDLGLWTLTCRGEELNCAAALFGHTHRAELSAYGALLLLNPGSPYLPRGGSKRSFAVLEIENGDVNANIKVL